jgi:hypothetical protein
MAQGETTSAIAGSVTDPDGAAISGATVTITSSENGMKRSVKNGRSGALQLSPIEAGNLLRESRGQPLCSRRNMSAPCRPVSGRSRRSISSSNIASASESIVVTEQAPQLNPENPNTSTTLTAAALEDLPNPGGDMTYPLQFAAGALINTAGSGNDFVGGTNGYGNVQFNGLPSLSNGYIVDGLETNDPLTNLNSGLSTNLVLGLNSIAEVTVNTVSYAVDQGRYGASQVNYVTKSGTNRFHGNLYELWNGSRFNAADFFTNATAGNHQPRSTVNHFGGQPRRPHPARQAVLLLRLRMGADRAADRLRHHRADGAFQATCCSNCRCGGTGLRHRLGVSAGAATRAVLPEDVPPVWQHRGDVRCPFSAARSTAMAATGGNPPNGNGCANRQSVSHSSDDHEQVQTARIDYNIDAADTAWFRFQADTGLQAAYTDAINPDYSTPSLRSRCIPSPGIHARLFGAPGELLQPGVLLVREPVRAGRPGRRRWRRFPSCCRAAAPMRRSPRSAGSTIPGCRGGAPRAFSSTTTWRGPPAAHELRFGTNSRIFRLNDYDFGEGVPLVTYTTCRSSSTAWHPRPPQTFPLADSQPYRFLNLDFYAQDTWKLTRS